MKGPEKQHNYYSTGLREAAERVNWSIVEKSVLPFKLR